MDSIQASTEPIKRTNKLPRFAVLGVLVALVLAACSPADAQDNEPDPTDVKPAVAAVMALDGTAAADFQYMPNEIIDELEWDIEIEYNTRDVRMVYEHYHNLLTEELGFDQWDLEVDDDDEIEADYLNTTTMVWVEIEVERDDGRVEVDMDIEDPRTYAADAVPSGFSLTEFMGWDIPVNIAGVTIRDIEWDFSFDHPETDYRAVIAYYDQHLQDLGWNRTDVEDDGDEWEAEYRQDGVHIDLEVEEDDDGVEVEIELNKLRFYQGQQ